VSRTANRDGVRPLVSRGAALERFVKRPQVRTSDRLFWIVLLRPWRDWRDALVFVQPDTVPLSLEKDAPTPRVVQPPADGHVIAFAESAGCTIATNAAQPDETPVDDDPAFVHEIVAPKRSSKMPIGYAPPASESLTALRAEHGPAYALLPKAAQLQTRADRFWRRTGWGSLVPLSPHKRGLRVVHHISAAPTNRPNSSWLRRSCRSAPGSAGALPRRANKALFSTPERHCRP
jgi:hypothetical protein